MSVVRGLLKAIRVKQWTKNFFVFGGLIFARQLNNTGAVLTAVEAFFCFCILSSSIYLINDIADRHRDRMHPTKRNRPIASGQVPVTIAAAAFVILSIGGVIWSFLLNREFGFICVTYLLLMILYTFWIKHQVILDVFSIAAGFVLRALGGALVISVYISPWLVICTILLSLFLALSKRRAELVSLPGGETREALREYSLEFIDQMISVVTAATVISYLLYAFLSDTAKGEHGLLFTVPFVLYGVFRYLYLVYRKDLGNSPEQLIVEDRPMLVNILLWAAVSIYMMARN